MADDFEIQINQTIRVTRIDDKDDWYVSSVQDLDQKNLCISIPTQGPIPLILHRGDIVRISLVSGKERYEFETRMLGQRQDNIPLYVLLLPKEYRHVQLRDFVRIPIVMDMYYAKLPEEGQMPVFNRCNSLDLSGGGVRFLLEHDYAAGTMLFLRFTLPFVNNPVEIEVKSKVVRSAYVESVKRYHIVAKFEEISRRDQDLIVRFTIMKLTEPNRLR